MKTIKTFMMIGIASALMVQVSSCGEAQRENPLLQESTLPFGAPDFSKIDTTDYMPAFEAAIQQTRDNIAAIVENQDSATFENTILPYEDSGRLLDRVSRVFFALVEADRTPALAEIEKKVLPMLTDLENEISFNKPLFERIRQSTTSSTTRSRAKTRSCWRRSTRTLCARVPSCLRQTWSA